MKSAIFIFVLHVNSNNTYCTDCRLIKNNFKMGVQRGEAPLAGQGQRPCGVWGKAPKTSFFDSLNNTYCNFIVLSIICIFSKIM